jgi:hypothetical protein
MSLPLKLYKQEIKCPMCKKLRYTIEEEEEETIRHKPKPKRLQYIYCQLCKEKESHTFDPEIYPDPSNMWKNSSYK